MELDPNERWWRQGFPIADAKLVQYVREFREGILSGETSHYRCFMVCAPLATLLSIEGCLVRLVEHLTPEGLNHYFMLLPDGRVLDPTLDQFGSDHPDVYLGPPIPAFHGKALVF